MQRIFGGVLLACMLLTAGCASASVSATPRAPHPSHPMPDRVQIARSRLINCAAEPAGDACIAPTAGKNTRYASSRLCTYS